MSRAGNEKKKGNRPDRDVLNYDVYASKVVSEKGGVDEVSSQSFWVLCYGFRRLLMQIHMATEPVDMRKGFCGLNQSARRCIDLGAILAKSHPGNPSILRIDA